MFKRSMREEANGIIHFVDGKIRDEEPLYHYENREARQARRFLILLNALEGMAQSKQDKFAVVRKVAQEAIELAEKVD